MPTRRRSLSGAEAAASAASGLHAVRGGHERAEKGNGMDGMAYDLCVICGDYVFDYEVEEFGEVFFAAGTTLPSHHNACLTERFSSGRELDRAYVADNKPETVTATLDFLQTRLESFGGHGTKDSDRGMPSTHEPPGTPVRGLTSVEVVLPCRYAFPSREAL